MIKILSSLYKARKMHFNLLKTLFFNFKVFRFKDAMKLPVLFFGRVQFGDIHRGCIDLQRLSMGVVKFGGGMITDIFGYSRRKTTYLSIRGKLLLGSNVIILQGMTLSINEGAVLTIGNNINVNENFIIHAKERITIMDNCRIGWNVQIVDSNFHYMLIDGKISYRNKPVLIANNVWLANGVSIMKGVQLPAYSVVASGSIVNKDFSTYGEHCLFGGVPAKFLKRGVERLLVNESNIDKLFINHNDVLSWEDVKEKLKGK